MNPAASPFGLMAQQLGAKRAAPSGCSPRGNSRASRTESIRKLLQQNGPMTAAEVLAQLDMPEGSLMRGTGIVGALLKLDLARGSVCFEGGKYHWRHEWDEEAAQELQRATALLRRNGYAVTRITHQATHPTPEQDEQRANTLLKLLGPEPMSIEEIMHATDWSRFDTSVALDHLLGTGELRPYQSRGAGRRYWRMSYGEHRRATP